MSHGNSNLPNYFTTFHVSLSILQMGRLKSDLIKRANARTAYNNNNPVVPTPVKIVADPPARLPPLLGLVEKPRRLPSQMEYGPGTRGGTPPPERRTQSGSERSPSPMTQTQTGFYRSQSPIPARVDGQRGKISGHTSEASQLRTSDGEASTQKGTEYPGRFSPYNSEHESDQDDEQEGDDYVGLLQEEEEEEEEDEGELCEIPEGDSQEELDQAMAKVAALKRKVAASKKPRKKLRAAASPKKSRAVIPCLTSMSVSLPPKVDKRKRVNIYTYRY